MFFPESAIFEIFLLITGIAGVWIGADSAVEGASLLGAKLGISPTVVGLTVVAVGTSLPELLICLIAALRGSADIAAGNIVGSNVSNICLIIGISAALSTIYIRQGLRAETIAAASFLALLVFLCSDGALSGAEGGAVVMLLVPLKVYLYLRQGGKTEISPETKTASSPRDLKILLFFISAGLVGLALGSKLVVESAVAIAHRAGVPELVIGATAVAVGTSLPELAASLAAVARREHSIAIGNLAGSNLFNIIILGLTASIVPLSIDPELVRVQLPFAIAVSAFIVPFMTKGSKIGKKTGTVLLLLYGVFIYMVF